MRPHRKRSVRFLQETQADTGTKGSLHWQLDVSSIVRNCRPFGQQQDDLYTGQLAVWSDEVPSGSGILPDRMTQELLIITNNHVVEDSEELSVTFIDNQSVKAAVKVLIPIRIWQSLPYSFSDIPGRNEENRLKAADLGDSDSLKLGRECCGNR